MQAESVTGFRGVPTILAMFYCGAGLPYLAFDLSGRLKVTLTTPAGGAATESMFMEIRRACLSVGMLLMYGAKRDARTLFPPEMDRRKPGVFLGGGGSSDPGEQRFWD